MSTNMEECIKSMYVLYSQDFCCPPEVKEDVEKLWMDYELGNDFNYFPFVVDEEEDYPEISKFLRGQGIRECLLHYYW